MCTFRMVLMALRHVQHRNVLDVCFIRFVNNTLVLGCQGFTALPSFFLPRFAFFGHVLKLQIQNRIGGM